MNCSILWIVREPIHEYFLSNQNQQYLQCAKSSRLDMLLTLKKKKKVYLKSKISNDQRERPG